MPPENVKKIGFLTFSEGKKMKRWFEMASELVSENSNFVWKILQNLK